MDEARLEEVLADDYIAGVESIAMDELRARRAACQALEVELSYQRRMAQGRLDIVGAEQRRRRGDAAEGDLVSELTDALTDRGRPAGNGRLPQLLAPDEAGTDTSVLDAIVPPMTLANLGESGEDELGRFVDALSAFETGVSGRRRELHERIDALQAEITRRYRTGEATVDSLLK
jgi:hypothetical protein